MLQVGIVGLPNVGKSTLFVALTKKQVPCENFPFCTIDPNVGVVGVADARLEVLAAIEHSAKTVPTAVEFVDIAGIVEGAHKGEGLGNKFLAAIREVDAICHVIRAFEDSNVHHVAGSVNPDRDRGTIITELVLADVGTMQRIAENVARDARGGSADAVAKKVFSERLVAHLNDGNPAVSFERTVEEVLFMKEWHLLTDKPIVEVINSKTSGQPSEPGRVYMDIKLESELASLEGDELQTYLKELGLEEPALNRLVRVCYSALDLLTFFTAGEMEARAWTVQRGGTAPEAAGKIHGDFQEKFIKAEIVSYDDFVAVGGWKGVKEKGKMRLEGKTYVMQEGDVVYFHHG
ncbi:MAG: redox-regulated ATPase YchF [bacterium]|nr:redox-regulated ATPase YchF [bacterium]